MKKVDELSRYRRALGDAIEALQLYADVESYHAVVVMADRPAGAFADDFSYDKGYGRKMPGKAARRALRALERKYGDLKIL